MLQRSTFLGFLLAFLVASATVGSATAQHAVTTRDAVSASNRVTLDDPRIEAHVFAGDAEAGRQVVEELLSGSARTANLLILTPGESPEGDNIGEAVFTPDGTRLLLANGYTDNLTVLDAATLEVLANVDVCNFPTGVAAAATVAVVGCLEGLTLVDLGAYTTAEVTGLGEVGAVEIMPDGMHAVVADVETQTGQIIDLATSATSVNLPTLPVGFVGFEALFPTTRLRINYSRVLIAEGGTTLIAPRFEEEGEDGVLLFIDATTGAVEEVAVGVNAVELVLSEDGGFVVAADRFENEVVVRVDVATRTVDATYTMPSGVSGSGLGDFTVSADGRRVLTAFSPEGGGSIQNYVIDLVAGTEQSLGTAALIHWHKALPGGRYAVGSGVGGTAVFDFETETVTQIVGPDVWAWGGAVTPDGGRFASWTVVEKERAFTYDISDGTASLIGEQVSGAPAEADSPINLSIYPGGDRALVTNRKSYNLSVLDLETLDEVEIIDVPGGVEPRRSLVLRDGRRALVGNRQPPSWQLQLLNLETGSLLGTRSIQALPEARGVGDTAFALDLSDRLYFFDTSGDDLRLVEGPSTFVVDAWAALEDGTLFLGIDQAAELARFYDGRTGLVAAEFAVSEPEAVAFSSNGRFAFVLSAGAREVFRYAVDGTAVAADGSFSCACSDPVYVAANDGVVGVAAGSSAYRFDLGTGDLIDVVDVGGRPSWLAVRPNDGLVAYVDLADGTSALYLDGVVESLPRSTFEPEYARESDLALLPLPGPDAIVVGLLSPVSNEVEPSARVPLTLTAAPNPARKTASVNVTWEPGAFARGGRLEVFDLLGRRVRTFSLGEHRTASQHAVVEVGSLPSGVYVIRASVGQHQKSLRLTVVE